MSETLTVIEEDIHSISKTVASMLGRLAALDGHPSPTAYQASIREVMHVRDMWLDHLQLENHILHGLFMGNRHTAPILSQCERDRAEIRRQLDALCTAPWPRSVQAGLNTVRFRATRTMTLLLRQLIKERTTILPLLRRRAGFRHEFERAVGRLASA